MSEVYLKNLIEYRDKLISRQFDLYSQIAEVERLLKVVRKEIGDKTPQESWQDQS
jgi:hypothetical protein